MDAAVRTDAAARMDAAVMVDAQGYVLYRVAGAVRERPGLVRSTPDPGLVRPRWTGAAWEETASAPEPELAATAPSKEAPAPSDPPTALARLEAAAEQARAAHSPGPLGLQVLAQRCREARALLLGEGKEDPTILQAEAEATGQDLKTQAKLALLEHAAWVRAMAPIEATLRRYTASIGRATDPTEVQKLAEAGVAALAALARASAAPLPSAESSRASVESSRAEPASVTAIKPTPVITAEVVRDTRSEAVVAAEAAAEVAAEPEPTAELTREASADAVRLSRT